MIIYILYMKSYANNVDLESIDFGSENVDYRNSESE